MNSGQLSGFDLQPELLSEPLVESSYKATGLSSTVARAEDGTFSNNGQEHEQLRNALIFITIYTSVAQAEQLVFKIKRCIKKKKNSGPIYHVKFLLLARPLSHTTANNLGGCTTFDTGASNHSFTHF